MLFYLNNSLLDELTNNDGACDECIGAIHEILTAQKKGDHLFFCEKELLDYLISSNLISNSDKYLLQSFQSHSPQYKILKDFAGKTNVINGKNIYRIECENSKLNLFISPDVVVKTHITDQPYFLAENLKDIDVYEKIARAIMFDKKQHFNLSFIPANGSGGQVYQVYDKYQKLNERLCLAIIDSDKNFPSAHYGSTARNLQKIDTENKELNIELIFSNYFIYDAHEIENLLPIRFLEEITEGSNTRVDMINWIEELNKIDTKSRLFIDVKNGMSLKDDIDNKNGDYINYWINKVKSHLQDCSFIHYRKCRANGCHCFVINGMGENVLNNSINKFHRITDQKFSELVKGDAEVYKIWYQIYETILVWFCAPNPKYIYGKDE